MGYIHPERTPAGVDLYRLSFGLAGCWVWPDTEGKHVDPVVMYQTIQEMQRRVPLGGLGNCEVWCTSLTLFAGEHPTDGMADAKSVPGCVFVAARPTPAMSDLVPHEFEHELARRLFDGVELAELRSILGTLYGSDDPDATWQDRSDERIAEYVSAALWESPIDRRMPTPDAETLARVREWAIRSIGPQEPAEIVIDGGPAVVQLQIGNRQYTIDGVPHSMDVAPVQVGDARTFVPVRFVAEGLGASVSWDSARQQVTIQDGDTSVVLTIGSTAYAVNGEAGTMDAAPFLQDDSRTMVPVRFVAEALGANVDWDEQTRTVTITR